MRLPWPFRRQDSTPARGPRPQAPRESSIQRAPLDEWRDVDPPAAVSGSLELTADEHFGDSLTGHRGLPPVLQPVARGGDLTPLVPSTAAARPSRGGNLPGAPRASTRTYRAQRSAVAEVEGLDEAVADTPSFEDGAGMTPGSVLPPAPIPKRVNPTTPSAVGNASNSPQRAPRPADLTIVPAAQRAAIDEAGFQGHISLDAPSEATQRDPSAEAVSPLGEAMPPRSAAPPQAGQPDSRTGDATATGSRRRPTLGQSRRAGLGAPLPLRSQPQAERVSVGDSTSRPQRSAVSATPLLQTAATAFPSPSVQTRPAGSAPTGFRAEADDAQASHSTASAPLRIRRTRTPRRQTQRAPTSATGSSGAEVPAASTAGPVRIDRSESSAATAADLGANAFTSGDTIVMPASHGPLDRGRGQALLAHELVHVNQQRSLGSSLPTEDSSAGQALEREAQSAESLVGQTGRSPSPTSSMPLAPRQNSSADQRSSAGTPSQAVSEATSVALAAGEAGTPGGESGSIDVPSPGAAVRTTHAAQRSPASAGAAPSSSGESESSADGDFDELARRIYERVRLRLRRELLLDRERGGRLTDSR